MRFLVIFPRYAMRVLLTLLMSFGALQTHVHAVDNKKIMTYGLYQTPDKAIWMRCALGQKWTGLTCIGKANEYTWEEAQKVAKTFEYKTQKNWRLPTIAELHGIIECSSGFHEKTRIPQTAHKKTEVPNLCNDGARKPTLDRRVFPSSPDGLFWSGTPDPLQNGFAWYTFFGGGYSHIYDMETKNYVRLVKDPIKLKKK